MSTGVTFGPRMWKLLANPRSAKGRDLLQELRLCASNHGVDVTAVGVDGSTNEKHPVGFCLSTSLWYDGLSKSLLMTEIGRVRRAVLASELTFRRRMGYPAPPSTRRAAASPRGCD